MFVNNQDQIIKEIERHAMSVAPEECCGLVLRHAHGFSYLKCRNMSATPLNSFRIDPAVMARYYVHIEYVVHSHPNRSPEPSKRDMAMADELLKPLLIISAPSLELCGYVPPLMKRDKENEVFFYGVNDCVSMAIDYYRDRFDMTHKNPVRMPYNWWKSESLDAQNNMLNNLIKWGFEVTKLPPRNGDIILIGYPNQAPCHIGIYQDGDILHNTIYSKSKREAYSSLFRRYTKCFLTKRACH